MEPQGPQPDGGPLERTTGDLGPSSHLCAFFETEAEFRWQAVPWLARGLARGLRVLCVVDGVRAQFLRAALAGAGVPDGQAADAVFHVPPPPPAAALGPVALAQLVAAERDLARDQGRPGLRVLLEAEAALGDAPPALVLHLESQLNAAAAEGAVSTMCCYDIQRRDPPSLIAILAAHPVVALGTRLFDNILYMPPRDFLKTEPGRGKIYRFVRLLESRSEAEARLRRSQSRFRGLFDHMTSAVAVLRPLDDGRDFAFDDVNKSLEIVEKMGRADMLGRPVTQILPSVGACGVLDALRRVHATGRPENLTAYLYKDERVTGWREGVLYRLPTGEVVFCYNDVTLRVEAARHLREKDEQLRVAQRMEAIGRLAGGVAHDFNNLLTVITASCELLMEQLADAAPQLLSEVMEVRQAAERAAALTGQLLAFSRRQVLQPVVLDLNEVLQGTASMLRRLIGEDLRLRLALDPQLGCVRADRGQMEQVVMNLAVNARDAMAAGGVLTLETRNVTLDAGALGRLDGLQPGPHVVVAVSDTGTGMTDEVKSHLFEPFFTTKGLGRGTGLGLPTVYGIVKQSGGDVAVRSEPGRGSTFEVFLPRVEGEPERRAVEPDDQPTMGTETVLLVEDEDSLRDLMEEILPHYGYRVITAQDGNAALKVLERHDGPVHLVLTDVVMPGMNGKELHDRLRNLHPSVRVLFMSGYTDDHIAHHGILEPGTPFIQKPFSMTKLAGKLRQVLDAPPP